MGIPYEAEYVAILKQESTANRLLIDEDDDNDPFYVTLNEAGDGLVVVEP